MPADQREIDFIKQKIAAIPEGSDAVTVLGHMIGIAQFFLLSVDMKKGPFRSQRVYLRIRIRHSG